METILKSILEYWIFFEYCFIRQTLNDKLCDFLDNSLLHFQKGHKCRKVSVDKNMVYVSVSYYYNKYLR